MCNALVRICFEKGVVLGTWLLTLGQSPERTALRAK